MRPTGSRQENTTDALGQINYLGFQTLESQTLEVASMFVMYASIAVRKVAALMFELGIGR